MTKKQIEKFAVGYPYPTDYVEILLKKYDFHTDKVDCILKSSREEVISEIQTEIVKNVLICIKAHMKAFEKWEEGRPVEYWEEDGVLCIRYESGKWWHYKINMSMGEAYVEWW